MNVSQVYSLQLETTSYCNARCPHCPRYDGYGNLHRNLQLDKWKWSIIKENFELENLVNLQQVLLQGDKGDPVMHPDIESIIKDFSNLQSQPIIELNSNGGVRNIDWWANLATIKNLKVAFSIDGLQDTSPIYRQNVDYSKVIENAKSFIENGGYAVWQCLIFKHNQHQMQEIKDYATSIGFKEVTFASCDVSRFEGKSIWNILENNKIIGILEPPEISDQEINSYSSDIKSSLQKQFNLENNCPNLRQGHLYVNCHGDIVPCCMMHYEFEFYNDQVASDNTIRLVDEFIKDRKTNNLNSAKLSNILKNDFLSKNLEQSFMENKFLSICENCCGNQIRENLVK